MKYRSKYVLVVVLVTVCLAAQATGGTVYEDKDGVHTMTKGTRKLVHDKPVDILLFHHDIKTEGSWFPYPRVQSHDICFPPKRRRQAKFTITAFSLEDLDQGGLAYMKKDGGGVGKHKVCFHLKSKRGHGYHFVVDVWGYYN